MTSFCGSVRGMHDVYGVDAVIFDYVIAQAKKASEFYGFESLHTPILEFSNLFERNLGQESDVVSKEIYKFADRGGEELALRPEFTAGVVRSLVEHSMTQNLPQKLFSYGPLFRYDRPQHGRYRQFNQVNFEIFGYEEGFIEVEAISCCIKFLAMLGIKSNTTLHLNYLLNQETRKSYIAELTKYLQSKESELSADSKVRLKTNPLRILDSKDLNDRIIIELAPRIADFYSESDRKFIDNLVAQLNLICQMNEVNIPVIVDPFMVRGLDYYNGIVFEFTTDLLGSQSTFMAGGRYDNLVSVVSSGKTHAPAIGFAAGVERLKLIMEKLEVSIPAILKKSTIAVIPVEETNLHGAQIVTETLRTHNIGAEIIYYNNIKKSFKKADGRKSDIVFVIGEDEEKQGNVLVKNMKDGSQQTLPINRAIAYVKQHH